MFYFQHTTHLLYCPTKKLWSVPFQSSKFDYVDATVARGYIRIINTPCFLHCNLKSRLPILVLHKAVLVGGTVKQCERSHLYRPKPWRNRRKRCSLLERYPDQSTMFPKVACQGSATCKRKIFGVKLVDIQGRSSLGYGERKRSTESPISDYRVE